MEHARTRFERAIDGFDELSSGDPRRDLHNGQEIAREVLYAQRMSAHLVHFAPNASEALRLAVRAQHLCRWRIPRSDYPMDRAGYKRWRSDLMTLHADLASGVLREVGYDDETIDRVTFLIKKRRLKVDPETQTLEDVACLVFLEYYLAEFAEQHDDDKLVDIIRKTWIKMSPAGHEAALKLPLGERELDLVRRALAKD